jgi:anti-repressor protein
MTSDLDLSNLLPVAMTTIGDDHQLTCDARTLHRFLGVQTRFNIWFPRRVAQYGFVQDVDFTLPKNGQPEIIEDSGFRMAVDYTLALGMAKELAMAEKTPKGKEVRRYFIECERRAKAAFDSTPAVRFTTTVIDEVLRDPKAFLKTLAALSDERDKNAELTHVIELKDQVIEAKVALIEYKDQALEAKDQVIETQTAKIERDKPVVEWAEGFESTGATTSVGDLARAITKLGYPIGPNRLFKHLRDEKYIQYVDGYNVPTQRSIDLKVLTVHEYPHKKPGGQEIIARQTRVTGKGHNYFLAKYKKYLDEENRLFPRRKAGG